MTVRIIHQEYLEQKEKQRLRRNQLARERYARKKALPEIYNILSDEGLIPVDTKPSLLTHICINCEITKTAKIFFYKKKQGNADTDEEEEEYIEEDDTPWCYANGNTCNCMNPCYR
jgi:hypothetical protein